MKGDCLCGKVKIEIVNNYDVSACHCGMCRRYNSGAPLFSIHSDKISIENQSTIAYYASSEHSKRAFCNHCGTHLFVQVIGKENNEYYVSAGIIPRRKSSVISADFC